MTSYILKLGPRESHSCDPVLDCGAGGFHSCMHTRAFSSFLPQLTTHVPLLPAVTFACFLHRTLDLILVLVLQDGTSLTILSTA